MERGNMTIARKPESSKGTFRERNSEPQLKKSTKTVSEIEHCITFQRFRKPVVKYI